MTKPKGMCFLVANTNEINFNLKLIPKRFIIRFMVFSLLFLLRQEEVFSQAANNTCATATLLSVSGECNTTAGDMYLANNTNPTGSCGNRADVWYRFVVPANSTSVSITVGLTSSPSSLTTTNTFIELFNTTNCTINNTSIQGCNNISTTRTYNNLTAGATYYFRIYTTAGTGSNPTRWGFTVCVTSNDDCSNATNIVPGSTINYGSVFGASASGGISVGCATGNPDDDVWYKFTAVASYATITLSTIGSDLTTSGAMLQVFSGDCTTHTSLACGRGYVFIPSGLVAGNTYYIRVYSSGTGQAGFTMANSSFRISVTPSAPVVVNSGRMNEVYHQTILSSVNTLDNPWEVTYGPDDKLWITESKGYRLYRIDPVTGSRDTVLDISFGSTFLPVGDQPFNMQFNIVTNNPQGGFAGMALHPSFLAASNPKNYVYLSYVHTYGSNTDPNGIFYTNRVVRFTYNTGTGKLESPVSLCDTLPGSNDHNSQRMIIVPVGGTPYLFYASGDMGGGQFSNRLRVNKAQLTNSYEGKILRFNLEPDADAGTLDKWIPNDNPFNVALGVQSAVWVTGIRNNQGFAYDTALNKLYGSSHGPYSDDEINVIEQGRNYGHPLVIGKSADGNYNGITAGSPLPTAGGVSTCPVITDEVTNAATIGPTYKDPLFSAYPSTNAALTTIWNTNPNNAGWPSEGWSGLELYTQGIVPGWKKSLIATSLKWGRLVKIRLYSNGDSVVKSGGQDTVSYFGSTNRFRDLAIESNGKNLYVIMDKSTTTSGPSANFPVVPACPGCLQKYSFLGYADVAGKSNIPNTIDVSTGVDNSCAAGTTVDISGANTNYWVPITGPDGNIMAEIYANGQTLGTVTSSFYRNTGPIRNKGNARYLDRNITITPQNQPVGTVKVRFYFSKAEFDALDANPFSLVSTIDDVKIHHNSDPCQSSLSGVTTLINPVFSEAFGANGYMLQADISSFSSFYFGAANVTLPLSLISFTGKYNSGDALLNWETQREVNTDYFVIERSNGNNAFDSVGIIDAKGTNLKTRYAFTDRNISSLNAPNLYYRLKMMDKHGAFTYSNIVMITVPNILVNGVVVFPNPAKDEATISLVVSQDQQITWQLVDNIGRVIYHVNTLVLKGSNKIRVDLKNVPAGPYFIKINGPYVNAVQKLQKQ